MDGKSKTGATAPADKTAGKGGKDEKGELLMKPPKGPFKQRSLDGKSVIKETCPKAIQDAADYWFGKKTAEARAVDATKKAAKDVLKLMEEKKITHVVVFNSEIGRKWGVNILQGEEKLKIEKNIT